MTTNNYFDAELGFMLTASDANDILIALTDLIIFNKRKGYIHTAESLENTRRKIESQLRKYENL